MAEKKKEQRAPSATDMCTCGHMFDQHTDGEKCASWKCVCSRFLDVIEQRRAQYGE